MHVDRHVHGADGVLVVNWLGIENELARMRAIGLGKQKGDKDFPRPGWMQSVADALMSNLLFLGGLAIVAAEDKMPHIDVLLPDAIKGPGEARLLALTTSRQNRLSLGSGG